MHDTFDELNSTIDFHTGRSAGWGIYVQTEKASNARAKSKKQRAEKL
jgi:hypothetical protein